LYQELIKRKRFQNRIAESRWSALATGVISLVIWMAAGLMTLKPDYLVAFVCLAMTSVMMGQLNSVNALIRIYSRMIMCSFLVITCIATFLFSDIRTALVSLCSAIFYIFLFHCYQDKNSPGYIYYAYLAIGLASVFWVQILFFLPVLWVVTSTNILALNFRNFIASLLGVLTPYWFLLAWYAYTYDMQAFADHFTDIAKFGNVADYTILTSHQVITFAFIVLITITGMIHYANTAHKDNIRTRMFYETFITVDVLALTFVILQPQHFAFLYSIMAINTAPLIGHFIALTKTKWTNAYFKVLLAIATAICAYNIFVP
jgi:hypothetical protein